MIALILVCINTVLNINPATIVLWSGFFFFPPEGFLLMMDLNSRDLLFLSAKVVCYPEMFYFNFYLLGRALVINFHITLFLSDAVAVKFNIFSRMWFEFIIIFGVGRLVRKMTTSRKA